MTPRTWFHTAGGELRAPWRIVVFLGAAFACALLAGSLVTPALSVLYSLAGVRVSADGWGFVAALLGAHVLALRLVDKRPWSEVWLDRAAARPALLARGFLLGALAIGIPMLLLAAGSWMRFTPNLHGSWLAAALRVSLVLLPAALSEELATRGYVFAVLRLALGSRWALAVTSVVFGLLHLQNAGANAQSLSLVILAGIFLGGVLLATRSLYAAWMSHFAWNWTLAVVFHTAVSGYPFESPDYRFVDTGPDWATGGIWGPEGGAAGGLGMVGALGYLYARRASRRREDA